MRTLIATLALLALAACSTPQQQEFQRLTCDTALQAWQAYSLARTNGLPLPTNVVIAAETAAPFLAAYCGWYTPRDRGAFGQPLVDTNGVLVIWPPLSTKP